MPEKEEEEDQEEVAVGVRALSGLLTQVIGLGINQSVNTQPTQNL